MQTGNQNQEDCTCPLGGRGIHHPKCKDSGPIPDWVDICKQLADIEESINNLKRQIMRNAGEIKGI